MWSQFLGQRCVFYDLSSLISQLDSPYYFLATADYGPKAKRISKDFPNLGILLVNQHCRGELLHVIR